MTALCRNPRCLLRTPKLNLLIRNADVAAVLLNLVYFCFKFAVLYH